MTARAAAAIAVVSAAVTPVLAQRGPASDDAASRARAADDSARAHYDAHEYTEAIADYHRAFEAMPDPLYLFDIAQAHRKLHDCANAAIFYRNYLHEAPTADNRDKVERFIAEMEACTPPPVDARVEAAPIPPAPPIDRAGPPATDEPVVERRNLRLAGVIAAGAGVVVAGLGVYFSVDAANRASDLENHCAHGCDGADVVAIDEAGKTASHRALASYVIGGAAIATGATLYLWATLHPSRLPVIVSPTPGGVAVSTSVRF